MDHTYTYKMPYLLFILSLLMYPTSTKNFSQTLLKKQTDIAVRPQQLIAQAAN